MIILQVEGVKGLFHGMMPRMLRRTFMAAFTWAFFEQVQDANSSVNFTSAFFID